jgi:hypothetical protein
MLCAHMFARPFVRAHADGSAVEARRHAARRRDADREEVQRLETSPF